MESGCSFQFSRVREPNVLSPLCRVGQAAEPPKYYYNEYIQPGFRVTTHLKYGPEKDMAASVKKEVKRREQKQD